MSARRLLMSVVIMQNLSVLCTSLSHRHPARAQTKQSGSSVCLKQSLGWESWEFHLAFIFGGSCLSAKWMDNSNPIKFTEIDFLARTSSSRYVSGLQTSYCQTLWKTTHISVILMCTLLGGPCMHIAYFEPVDCPRVSQLGVTQLSLLDLTEHNELFTVIHRLNWKTRHVILLLDDNSFCLKALYNWLSEILAEAHASMLWWYHGTETLSDGNTMVLWYTMVLNYIPFMYSHTMRSTWYSAEVGKWF